MEHPNTPSSLLLAPPSLSTYHDPADAYAGHIFCNACSNHRAPVKDGGEVTKVRVCKSCIQLPEVAAGRAHLHDAHAEGLLSGVCRLVVCRLPSIVYRLLAAGCWLLAAGCWLPSTGAGCWLLAAGCWLLAASCWLLAAGCWLLAAGCWLLAAGCWLLAAGCWLLVAGWRPHTTLSWKFRLCT
jgi:hypothetical protein